MEIVLVMLQIMLAVVFWPMLRVIHQHLVLHLHLNLIIKGRSKKGEILIKETKEEGLFQMELCQTIKNWNKLFTDAMAGMNKKFYVDGRDHENLLAANGNGSSITTTTTATTTTTFYGIYLSTNSLFSSLSAQQAEQKPIYYTMNNTHQTKIISTPQHTMNSQTLTVVFMFLVVNI